MTQTINIIATEAECHEAFSRTIEQHPDGPPDSDEETLSLLGGNLLNVLDPDSVKWSERPAELVREAGEVVAQCGGYMQLMQRLGIDVDPESTFDRNGFRDCPGLNSL